MPAHAPGLRSYPASPPPPPARSSPAAAPAEARALVTTPEPEADPLERLDLIETNLLHKFPQLTREEIRAIQPFFTLVVSTFIFGTLARMPTEGDAPYALLVFAGLLP